MNTQTRAALEKQNPWWFGKPFDTGINRLDFYPHLLKYLEAPEVLLLLGARRTGKSTLLLQIIKHLNVKPEAVLFINLDEPLFQSRAEDPAFLSELIEDYMLQHKDIGLFYLFIDEVQNYNHWVHTVKTLHDTCKNVRIVLTGSTSGLLQKTVITRLSGRYFHVIIRPLSFAEYLTFKGVQKASLLEKKQHAQEYLKYGAFPRVVLEKDEVLVQELLKTYFQTIYLKDIIFPHNLRNNRDVFDLLYFVISNIGRPFSYTKIAEALGLATDTVKEYLGYAEEAYLVFPVTKYDPSVRRQLANQKKFYCLDTGLVSAVSFRFSENKGWLLENLVCMTLKRRDGELFYHKGRYECDFVFKEGGKITEAIQVALSLRDQSTRERELRGLMEALDAHGLERGLIITEEESETLERDGKTIQIVPLHEWLEQQQQ